jgi:hypothetical protein
MKPFTTGLPGRMESSFTSDESPRFVAFVPRILKLHIGIDTE